MNQDLIQESPPELTAESTEPAKVSGLSPLLSIIIPCHNEEDTIEDVVSRTRAVLDSRGYVAEIIVVNNHSTDASARRARNAGAHVIEQPIRGYGASILAGIHNSQGRHVVMLDADGTYNPEELHRFIEPLLAGHELVLGTRRNGLMEPGSMGFVHRHFLEPIQTWLLRNHFGVPVSDVRCGLRSISRKALERLDLGSTGMEFAGEMLTQAAKHNLDVIEVPVDFKPRPSGKQRRHSGDSWRVIRDILLLSPTRLFEVPGLLLLVFGLLLEAALATGPVFIGGFVLDYHFMFVGGGMAILGLQLMLLGIYAKTYALINSPEFADPWIKWIHRHYTLERGVLLGLFLFLIGLGIDIYLLADWLAQGRPVIFAVRPAIAALTLLILGAEILFASFFISLLRRDKFSRV